MTDAEIDRPRVLAVHSGALGDVILFAHLLARIGGRATLVAGGEKARLLEGLGIVAEAMDFDALPMHEVFTDTPIEQCRLPKLLGAHDRLVSCFGDSSPAARQRLAAMCTAADAAFLPVRPPKDSDAHLLDFWADLLGIEPQAARCRSGQAAWQLPPPAVPDSWRIDARGALASSGIDVARPYVVMHPGAGAAEKCWPLEKFASLAGELGGQVVVVLGPVEQERWAATLPGLPRIESPSLATLAGVLSGATVFVGNDSGPAHLAAWIGAPTVAVFGPTRPEQFAPVGGAVRTRWAPKIDQISVAEVVAAVEDLAAAR